MIDLDKHYQLAPGRKFRLPRTEGNVENGSEGFGGSDLGVLLQYRAHTDHIPQPPALCFENEWQPEYDAALCETPLKVVTLNIPVINKARLLGPGIVLANNDVILSDSVGRHAKRKGLEISDDGTGTFSADLKQIVHRAQSDETISQYEGVSLLLFDPAIRHFGMWVLKCLPKLTILPLLSESDVRVVVPTSVPDKYLALMQALGISTEQIIFHDPESVSVFGKLLVPPKMYTFGKSRYGNPFEVFCKDTGKDPRGYLHLLPLALENKRIYVTRRGNNRRRLVNEKAVEQLFAEFGFQIVEPSTLTAVQTLSLFRDCEFIAGPFGSGLYNILFSRRAPRALVLTPPLLKFSKQFLTMGHVCTSKGGNAGYIFGRTHKYRADQAGEFDYSWEIDMGRLREVLVTLTQAGE